MDRITKRIDDTHACYAICEKECPDGIYADNPACMCAASKMAMKRLLEYEDTGLTPEQIRELKERDTAMEINEIHIDEYYCPACGAENNCNQGVVEDNFCPRCGQRLKMKED